MSSTKRKKNKEGIYRHYCPSCGVFSGDGFKVIDTDIKKRAVGAKLKHPEFGQLLKCKCGWQGEWFIESKIRCKLQKMWQSYQQSSKSHLKKNKFGG